MELSSPTSDEWCMIKCMLFDENYELGISGCEVYLGTKRKSYTRIFSIGYRLRFKKNTEYKFSDHNIYLSRSDTSGDHLQLRFDRLEIKFQNSIRRCEQHPPNGQHLITKNTNLGTYDLIFPCETDDVKYITEPVTSASTVITTTAGTTNAEETTSPTQPVTSTTKNTDVTPITQSSTEQKTNVPSTNGAKSTTESVTVPENTDGSISTAQDTKVKKTNLPTSDGEKPTTVTTPILTTNGKDSTMQNREQWSKKDIVLLSFMLFAISLLVYDIVSRRVKSARVRNLLYST
ncbi:hypothetical protein RF11_00894 [Thelohanellus kitauei]|uniref:Uncharacterized protein n=1 Tax=Thelohanellus kitauei TaxID=669202 RepID=A0A0C2JNF6_THEKT|nr:hypothetical protein RF11_00894 [Thelohanellus kitauei]